MMNYLQYLQEGGMPVKTVEMDKLFLTGFSLSYNYCFWHRAPLYWIILSQILLPLWFSDITVLFIIIVSIGLIIKGIQHYKSKLT